MLHQSEKVLVKDMHRDDPTRCCDEMSAGIRQIATQRRIFMNGTYISILSKSFGVALSRAINNIDWQVLELINS